MQTLTQVRFFHNTTYTITEDGLLVSKKLKIGRVSRRLIPFEDIGSKILIESVRNKNILYSSLVFLILSLLWFSDDTPFWVFFLFISGILIFIFFRTTIDEEGVKNMGFIPNNPNKTEYEKFMKNLIQTKDNFEHYKETDEMFGTDFYNQFSEIIKQYNNGELTEEKFGDKKRSITWSVSHQYARPGFFPN